MRVVSPAHLPTTRTPLQVHPPNEGWDRVLDAVRQSRSQSTTATYRTYLAAWANHAQARGVQVRPAHPSAVAEWLTTMADQGKSISTLHVARAALAAAHREAGLEDPTVTELVKRVLSGLARESARKGRRPSQVKALTAEDLQSLINHFTSPDSPPPRRTVLRDLAMVQVMRDGMLRRGEAAALVWEDITRAADGSGRLIIRHSKTDQEGKGAVLYLGRPTMAALDRIRPTNAPPETSVFGISGSYISTRITLLSREAGLGPGYSGHSCRIGMAQDLAAEGYSLTQLMTAGRWTHPAMPARYTRNQAAARNAVALYYQQISRIQERLNKDRPPGESQPDTTRPISLWAASDSQTSGMEQRRAS